MTNGYVAQELDYATATPEQFRPVAASLTTQIGQRGTLWAARSTRIYVVLLVLVVLGGLAGAVAVWFLSIHLLLRIVAFSAIVLAVASFARLRGRVCARSFAKTLFSPSGRPTRLADVNTGVDHVICATELHSGEHVYFSGRFVRSYRFGLGKPADLSLHDAVQSSAAFPGAFPPRSLEAKRHDFDDAGDERARSARRLVLVDGGAYDNMGTEWALGPGVRDVDQLIVVNSSAPLDWSGTLAVRAPLVGEVAALKRDIDVLYDTTTSTRRRWLFDTFGADQSRMHGAFVQISQSPFRVARDFARPGEDKFSERANAVLAALGDTDGDWTEVVRANSDVKTTLSKLGGGVAARLVHHGYVLAMANLHVILDYPLLEMPTREDFERLAGERR